MRHDHAYRPRKGWRLVICQSVRHWRSGKMMTRKNGKPFAFWVRTKS